MTRIVIALESDSHGLSEIVIDFLAEIGNANGFSTQKQVTSKKKKVFNEIGTNFWAKIGNPHGSSGRITATTSRLRHPNTSGGAAFIFSAKIGLKSTKTCNFAYFIGQWGGSSPPPPLPTLLISLNKYEILFVFCIVISSRKLGLYDRKKLDERVGRANDKITIPAYKRDAWLPKFKRINTAIPSSAAVERLFAVGSDILRSKRSSMMKENFEKFVLLHENEKCLKKSIFLHE